MGPRQDIKNHSDMAFDWWDPEGPARPLHAMNDCRVDWIQKTVPLKGRGLDIGCGGGLVTERLSAYLTHVTGIDPSEAMIEVARAHQSQDNIDYVCGFVENWVAGDFDLVTLLECLEHVDAPELLLKAAYDRLSPGGYLVVSTLNRTWKAFVEAILGAEYVLNWIPRGTHRYEDFIKPSEIDALLSSWGARLLGETGVSFQGNFVLSKDLSVNYMLAYQKPSPCEPSTKVQI